MKNINARPDGVTKEEMERYIADRNKSIKKVNSAKYETLKCLTCDRCKKISEVKTRYFNLYRGTGHSYLITCDDGYTRECEVGQDSPSDCLIFDENFTRWQSENDRL
jgi:hypothetical protein